MRATLGIALAAALAVQAQQPITVLEPNGGETYALGDTMHIRWDADQSTPLVMLEMSMDSGESWYGVYTSGIPVDTSIWGDYPWVVTDSLPDAYENVSTVSSRCLVRVRNYVDQVTNDISDGVFTVLAEHATVQTPSDPDDCGCGSGTGTALLVPLGFRLTRRLKKRRRSA